MRSEREPMSMGTSEGPNTSSPDDRVSAQEAASIRTCETDSTASNGSVRRALATTDVGPVHLDVKAFRARCQYDDSYNRPRSQAEAEHRSPNKNASLAIVSFVLSLIALFLVWLPYGGLVLPILALIFGLVGCVQTSSLPTMLSGRGLAIAGIVIGTIGLALALIMTFMRDILPTFVIPFYILMPNITSYALDRPVRCYTEGNSRL